MCYLGDRALHEICMQGYIPHVRPLGAERTERTERTERDQGKRARRWVVEVAYSWCNRFRELLVRYETLHRAYLALTMFAAAIITFPNVPSRMNIIYG